MFHRLVLTLATACTLTGMFVVYSAVIRPIVVIPAPPARNIDDDYTDIQRPYENARVAKKYLAEKKWVAVSKYMLRNDEAFVYTDKWDTVKENRKRVIFKPFAMVWLTSDKAGIEQAISISCDRAMVEFASDFDEKNPSPGRIVGAVLNGAVDIAGPDNLLVKGSEFHFEESALSLYTHNPVKFRYQSHRGLAPRMSMNLIPAEGLPGVDRPHVYGVESIHLYGSPNPGDQENQNVMLWMQLPQGDGLRMVTAKCSDELKYEVADATATLTKDVILWTGTKPLQDKLECDVLTMQFAPKSPEANDETASSTSQKKDDQRPPSTYQKVETNLEFSWLEAKGTGQIPVKIRSPANGLVARMDRFTYSEETRTVVMSSQGSSKNVEVTRNGSTLIVPQIEAQLDDLKKNVTSLHCLGKGELKYFDEVTGRLTYAAKWLKHLLKTTDAATNLDIVELDGDAQFRQPKLNPEDSSGLTADRIHIWLAPIRISLESLDRSSSKKSETPDLEPKRILAQNNVALQSRELIIERNDELEILFDDEEELQPTSVTQKSRGALPKTQLTLVKPRVRETMLSPISPMKTTRTASSQIRQMGFASIPAAPMGSLGPPVEIPFNDDPRSRAGTKKTGAVERTVVEANRIEVRVRRIPGVQEFKPKEVHSLGKVKIVRDRGTGQKPLILTGDRVDLTQIESEDQLIAHVRGTPALIRDREFEIEGNDIHLDRGENHAWVAGPGLLKLPIPADAKIPGSEAAENRDLIVHWDESMNFDGLEAKFLGDVKSELGLAKIFCKQMLVRLENRVSFQTDNFSTKPSLRTIHCHEDVSFENSTYKDKKMIDVYRGWVGDFTVNYLEGTVDAQGPGKILTWQRHEKNGGFAPRDTIQANRPIPIEVTVWDYTQVRFEGRMKGNFDGQAINGQSAKRPTREGVIIEDRVEVVYGPVKLPNEKIDPLKLPSMAGTMRCEQLRFVNHPESERNPKPFRELFGDRNAEVEGQVDGQRFTASADEISVDESNGLYILRSHGRPTARLTRVGSANLVARTIEFNPDPKLRILRVDHAVEGQGSQ